MPSVFEYTISSPVSYPWESILMVLIAVLIPDIVQVLLLFWYPVPVLLITISVIILFFSDDFILWTPDPKPVRATVLIPDIESLSVLYNLIVNPSMTDA